ncbi:MAG: coproporphyrinogen dehydrogenase HemZ [Clostridia bacterium]|nr:coproporphyrinogen dehydrogenase HemZ [Clostridia bacterium]
MILNIKGDINRYYVQTLSMIFFPGASFSEGEEPGPGVPVLSVELNKDAEGYTAVADVVLDGRTAHSEKSRAFDQAYSDERLRKLVVGDSVTAALGELMEYRPSWGILTGVRPSKVATELLNSGVSKTRTKRILNHDYMVFPKKADLAVTVALNEQRIIGTPLRRDCSLYISIPFCASRCAYCSFVSYTSQKLLSLIPDYIVRLKKDIHDVAALAREFGLNIKTVYFGGGTPSILEPDLLTDILNCVGEELGGLLPEEYTFEAGRPDSITAEKLAIMHRLGVKRISVNPQTLCEEVLEGVGRHHTVEDFYRAYSLARESGIETINTDLIAGLPGDSFKSFSKSIDGIIGLAPENVTVHTFCVKRSASINQTDNIYSMRGGDAGKCVDYSQIKLQQAGYIPYYMYRQKNTVGNFENVGFSLPGKEGKYNIYMMEEVHSILAVGAGAVTKFVRLAENRDEKTVITRFFNPKYPFEYLREDNCAALSDAIRNFYTEHPTAYSDGISGEITEITEK